MAIGQAPYLQDMNGVMYVMAYEIAYLFEEGIPEYDTTTTYYTGSIVKKVGTFELYGSLIDTNLGNALPARVSNSDWAYLGNLQSVSQMQAYRKPNLQYVSADTVDVEATVYNDVAGCTVLFPDGVLRTVNSLTQTRFNITRNAAISGSLQSGLRTSLSRAANTTYYLYAVVASDNDATWVTVGDTLEPVPANYATLNSNFGTGKWRPLGVVRNGDNRSATNVILAFIQNGDETLFTNADDQGVIGYRLVTTASGTSAAYTATSGTGATDLPPVANVVHYTAVTSAATGFSNGYKDAAGSLPAWLLGNTAGGGVQMDILNTAAANGAKATSSVSGTLAINCIGFRDRVLASGSLALL